MARYWLLLFVYCFASCPLLLPEPANAQIIRRSLGRVSPTSPEVAWFRQGVAAMKQRPLSDPTSWSFQANVHGVPGGGGNALWNQCQHGSFFFLSWHRMYLYFFERILRSAASGGNYGLPYWEWDNPSQRSLPVVLRVPADARTNSLYSALRSSTANRGASMSGTMTSTSIALSSRSFMSPTGSSNSFGGQYVPRPMHFASPHGLLEMVHDNVHVFVGGEMGNPDTAGRDSAFWVHHSNVDRLWNVWLRRGNQNPVTNGVWANTLYYFYDENRRMQALSGRDIVSARSQLGYSYDDEAGFSAAELMAPHPLLGIKFEQDVPEPSAYVKIGNASFPEPVTLYDIRNDLDLQLENPGSGQLRGQDSEKYILSLDFEFDLKSNDSYAIFLGLPTAAAADMDSPYYVGTLSSFGRPRFCFQGSKESGCSLSIARLLNAVERKPVIVHQDHHLALGPTIQDYDVTPVVEYLKRSNEWQEKNAVVTFLPALVISPEGQPTSLNTNLCRMRGLYLGYQ